MCPEYRQGTARYNRKAPGPCRLVFVPGAAAATGNKKLLCCFF